MAIFQKIKNKRKYEVFKNKGDLIGWIYHKVDKWYWQYNKKRFRNMSLIPREFQLGDFSTKYLKDVKQVIQSCYPD